MTVSTVPVYGGVVPDPNSQSPNDFAVNAVNWTSYQSASLVPGINTSIAEFNIDVGLVNGYKNDAAASALSAADSEEAAASSANFEGEWSTLTGAQSKGISVTHDGAFWRLLVDVANIALSEPSGTNSDWQFASGNRWQQLTASATVAANSQVEVYAVTGDVDLTQPTFSAKDFIVINNSIDSTDVVKLLNPSNTIKGKKGNIAATNNLVLEAGDTVHLFARTSTILEVIE